MLRKKLNKLISVIFAVILVVNSTAIMPAIALPNTNVIYCETNEVTAGDVADIPFFIGNNSGIAGFGIYISYDPNVFTPVSVTDSSGIIAGKTQNSIGGNQVGIPENTIKVICYGSQNFTDDGLLFTVRFNVNSSASGNTVLSITYDQNDTIDEDINDVSLSCNDANLSIINSGLELIPQIELSAEEDAYINGVVVRGVLREKKELSSATVKLQYNASAFDFGSISGLSTITNITSSTDLLSFSLSNINSLNNGDVIFELSFAYSENISVGQYSFNATAEAVDGADDIYFKNCSFEVSEVQNLAAIISSVNGLENNKGHIVSVPIIISNNPGLMGYKLTFSFNEEDIVPTSIINDNLLPAGFFDNNIGLKTNSFDVLWNSVDESDSDGQIFHIDFEVLTETIKNTELKVSYSKPDTYDENYEDVSLKCNKVIISLNSYTEVRNAKEATCCENGYTGDIYCKDCNELLEVGSVIPATGNHIDADGKWEGNGTQHWHTCHYGTQFDVASHSGGTATCTEKAKCSVCGVEYGEYGAHGETEIRNAKEPTCCENGYTGDTYCKDCSTKLSSGSVIPATGHHTDADGKWESNGTQHWHTCYYGTQFDVSSHSGGTATCTEKAKCSVCGAEYGDYAKHTLTHHGRVEPDCGNDGNIEYWTCDDCGKYFKDANGHNEISANDIIIAKLTITEYQFLDGEVIIEAPDGAIPEGSLFDVRKIVPPPAEVVEKVKDQMGSSSEVIAYYEIRLSDTDGMLIIHLDGEITIKIQMPAQYVGSNCVRVLQEDETGKLITMTSWWEGEYLCYKTDWLEIYAEP